MLIQVEHFIDCSTLCMVDRLVGVLLGGAIFVLTRLHRSNRMQMIAMTILSVSILEYASAANSVV